MLVLRAPPAKCISIPCRRPRAALCRPLLDGDVFIEPALVREMRAVREMAVAFDHQP